MQAGYQMRTLALQSATSPVVRRDREPPAESPGCMTELFTEIPDGTHRGLIARRIVMTVFALFSLAALIGFFGQRATTSTAATPSARLTLAAPEIVRGGIFFQARVEVRALEPIEHPRLVLDDGWLEGLQVNSIEPAAESESSRDGRLVLSYGALEPGDVLRIWLQFEVDPTNVGRRSFTVELDDEDRLLVRVPHTLRVLP